MPEPGRKRRAFQHPPPGSPPGTVVVDPRLPPAAMRVMAYGPTGLEETPLKSIADLRPYLTGWPVVWLDVDGLGEARVIAELAEVIGMHKLSLEDVLHVHQRAKVEDFGSYLFFVCRMPQGIEFHETEQVSLCLGKNFIVTFQETDHPGDVFERVRARLRQAESRIRSMPADYLAYSLIDSIVDSYFPILEKYGESIDVLEDQTLNRPRPESVQKIHRIKRELIAARRATWPMREMLNAALRDQTPLISPETRVYLRDCYDHTVQIIDLIETYRDLASGLMELYLSVSGNRLNEIMKVLTVISTVFIPLTFIVGVYGMNFDTGHPLNMPELRSPYGYLVVMAVMVLIAGSMVWMFWRRGWLGERRRRRRVK